MTQGDARPPKSARLVDCPTCGKASLFAPSNPWRPFCSERCRLNDLGAWATESYRIPANPAEDDSASAEGEPERGPEG